MLELYYHPLASYCWKVLVALYENETPFTPHFIDLANKRGGRDNITAIVIELA